MAFLRAHQSRCANCCRRAASFVLWSWSVARKGGGSVVEWLRANQPPKLCKGDVCSSKACPAAAESSLARADMAGDWRLRGIVGLAGARTRQESFYGGDPIVLLYRSRVASTHEEANLSAIPWFYSSQCRGRVSFVDSSPGEMQRGMRVAGRSIVHPSTNAGDVKRWRRS